MRYRRLKGLLDSLLHQHLLADEEAVLAEEQDSREAQQQRELMQPTHELKPLFWNLKIAGFYIGRKSGPAAAAAGASGPRRLAASGGGASVHNPSATLRCESDSGSDQESLADSLAG